MMSSDRDLEFCSGGDEEDLEMDNVHSPTDASEDSVEVKVLPISPRNRNKRKCAEPRKVANDSCTGPLKKRIRHHSSTITETNIGPNQSHFRPWSFGTSQMTSPVDYHPVFGYQNPTVHQEEPLSLVKSSDKLKIKEETDTEPKDRLSENSQDEFSDTNTQNSNEMNSNQQKLFRKNIKDKIRLPYKNILCKQFMEDKIAKNETNPSEDYSHVSFPYSTSNIHPAMRPSGLLQGSPGFSVESLLSAQSSVSDTSLNKHRTSTNHQKEQRNYKNMTRERRIEANARERTRVHTISAAFDTLRKSIPAYSHNQKLSKLSVLRIACSYILTLSRVAGYDYSADQSEPQLNDCVDLVSQTIQTEGKLRKKKDE